VKSPVHLSDIRGYSRLAVDATIGLTDLVENLHRNITRLPGPLGAATQARTTGISGLVYRSIRGVTRLVGGGIDLILAQLLPLLGEVPLSSEREALLAALNGVLGDHIAVSENPLAIRMRLRRNGQPLELTNEHLAAAIPDAGGKILLLAHGLCMNDLQWLRKGHDHGAALAADAGFTPVYLHYNSGLHVSINGRAFAALIEELLHAWPVQVEELVIVAHSMGGLLARSACHYAGLEGHAWPRRLGRIVFLGTPHHGAPLERGGNWVDVILGASPYSAAFARLGKIRSAGITDLRYGSLVDEDWKNRDRFARLKDKRRAMPLPDSVRCYTIGASIAKSAGRPGERLPGDGLVPLASALGRHANSALNLGIAPARQWVGYGMNHLDLLNRKEVYAQLRQWLSIGS
jgi:pimeloyl-ACP methyl ester carboxylesterase